jgi:4-hydroxy-2-oxoheptanedioate aldolase
MKQPNRVKAAMRAGRKAYGYNLSFPSPWVIDILGELDFVFLDGEHGPFGLGSRTSAGPPNAII